MAGLLVFLVAFLARASLFQTARFFGDQSSFFHILQGIRYGTAFPILGPALSGGAAKVPGAAFFYLMSLSQWLSPTPEAANLWASFLCSLGVLFFYLALKLEFGKKWGTAAALVPALLLAVSPWSVLFGESLDNGYVLSFLVGVAFWVVAQVRARGNSRWIAAFVVLCALMPQFHLSCPSVWAGLLVLLWPKRKEIRWSWFVAGTLAGLALYLPYVLEELRTGWANLHAFQAEGKGAMYYFNAWKTPFYLFKFLTVDTAYQELRGYWGGMLEWDALLAPVFGTPVRPFHILRLLCYSASVVFALQSLRQIWVRRTELGSFFHALVAAAGVNFALLLLTGRYFYPHYAQPVLMFLFACIPAWVVWVNTQKDGWKRWGVLLLLFCAGSIEASQTVSRVSDARLGLRVGRDLIENILADADREHWPDGSSIALREKDLPFKAWMIQPLLSDVYHRNFQLVDNEGPAVRGSYLVYEADSATPRGGTRPLDGGLMLLQRVK